MKLFLKDIIMDINTRLIIKSSQLKTYLDVDVSQCA